MGYFLIKRVDKLEIIRGVVSKDEYEKIMEELYDFFQKRKIK
ncbi:MAG TPA: hypothetical protein PKW55_03715 [Spirochaetota bacterium]|nr:hypothetical protein [Spirochaetota bacterium]HOM38058.1 hypothetical protein [Spirochaetota bacterium]